MITAEQLKAVHDRVEQLHRYLDIDAKKMQYEEEQLRTQDPSFWDDRERAEEQMKLVKGLEKWINGYKEAKTLADELQLAFEFYKDEMVTEEEVDADYARAIEAVAPRRRRHALCAQNQLGRRRHGSARLGFDAHAHVSALRRKQRL